jgi:thiamine-phosphate pyrophosphorylase
MTDTRAVLHVVTNDTILARPGFTDIARDLLALPLLLHLRAHQLPARQLHDLAASLKSPNLVINDRIDIALATECTAVQLGARSVPLPEARSIAPEVHFGYSAHSSEEAQQAEWDGADWVFLGTIYASASHQGVQPAGLDLVRAAAAACKGPVIAIGGVTAAQAAELKNAGAHGAAVIGAVWDAPDPVQAAAELVKMLA